METEKIMFYHPSGKKATLHTSHGKIETDANGAVEVEQADYDILMKNEQFAIYQQKVQKGEINFSATQEMPEGVEFVECKTKPGAVFNTVHGKFIADEAGAIALPKSVAEVISKNQSLNLSIVADTAVKVPPTPVETPKTPETPAEKPQEPTKAPDAPLTPEAQPKPEGENTDTKKHEGDELAITAETLGAMEVGDLKALASAKQIKFDNRYGKEKMIDVILAAVNEQKPEAAQPE